MKRMVALDHPIRSRRCLSSRYLVCPQSRPRVVGGIGIEGDDDNDDDSDDDGDVDDDDDDDGGDDDDDDGHDDDDSDDDGDGDDDDDDDGDDDGGDYDDDDDDSYDDVDDVSCCLSACQIDKSSSTYMPLHIFLVESMEGSSYNNSILPFSIIHLTP